MKMRSVIDFTLPPLSIVCCIYVQSYCCFAELGGTRGQAEKKRMHAHRASVFHPAARAAPAPVADQCMNM